MHGVWDIVCVMWCTSDVSFVFVVGWMFWVSGMGRKLERSRKRCRQEKGDTGVGEKSRYLSRPPQESGIPLSSITLLGNSEGLIEGLGNQGSSGDVLWGVVQKI